MAVERYDMVRLAEMRDAHAALVKGYQTSVRAVSEASAEAGRARIEAPQLPGAAPVVRHVYAPGIGNPKMPAQPRAFTNEFYLQPLTTLLSFTAAQLDEAQIDHRALSRIIVAENRLAKLRAQHASKAASARESAERMKRIDLFATEKRL